MAEAAISKTASVLNWQATFTYRRIIRMQKTVNHYIRAFWSGKGAGLRSVCATNGNLRFCCNGF